MTIDEVTCMPELWPAVFGPFEQKSLHTTNGLVPPVLPQYGQGTTFDVTGTACMMIDASQCLLHVILRHPAHCSPCRPCLQGNVRLDTVTVVGQPSCATARIEPAGSYICNTTTVSTQDQFEAAQMVVTFVASAVPR